MDEVCVFCGKPATKLCDFPMGYQTFAGHTPKAFVISDADGNDITSNVLVRCSRPMCNECSTDYRDMDFCPFCLKQMKKIIIHHNNLQKEFKSARKLRVVKNGAE